MRKASNVPMTELGLSREQTHGLYSHASSPFNLSGPPTQIQPAQCYVLKQKAKFSLPDFH